MSASPSEATDHPDCDCRPAGWDLTGTVPSPSRRALLRGAALTGATTIFGSAYVTTSPTFAAAATASRRTPTSTVVVLSLRGAADGLSLVVPHGDPAYYQA